jgi:hypothetical protein
MVIGDKKAARIKRLEERRSRGEKALVRLPGRGLMDEKIRRILIESSKQAPPPLTEKGPFINFDRMDAFACSYSSKCAGGGKTTLDLYIVTREGSDRKTGRMFVKCIRCGDTKDVSDIRVLKVR